MTDPRSPEGSAEFLAACAEHARTHPAADANVERVITRYRTRAHMGLHKYGTTTERTDIDLRGWLQHLQDELMDATVYVERLKRLVPGTD